jgi:hypothetical protein
MSVNQPHAVQRNIRRGFVPRGGPDLIKRLKASIKIVLRQQAVTLDESVAQLTLPIRILQRAAGNRY